MVQTWERLTAKVSLVSPMVSVTDAIRTKCAKRQKENNMPNQNYIEYLKTTQVRPYPPDVPQTKLEEELEQILHEKGLEE